MSLTVSDPQPSIEGRPKRHSRRFWVIVAAIPVLLIGGGVTAAVAVSFHYLHAPALENDGGSYGWVPPDNLRTRFVDLGPYHGLVTPARPNHWQSFSLDVYNPSSVTQTILGLATSGVTAEPEHLTVSTGAPSRDDMRLHYTSEPVAVPPGGTRVLRLTRYAGGCEIWGHGNGRAESYTDLQLRVQVGAFTRTEDVKFGQEVFELRGTGGAC